MLKALVRPRPIRVAYFVQEDESWKLALDAIRAECHGRWGGRFSLIVPCVGSVPVQEYDDWLHAYDPDIIYSYVDLPAAAVGRMHERLGPAFLVRHVFYNRERDARAHRPDLPLDPLGYLSVTPIASRGDGFHGPSPVKLVDAFGVEPSAFLMDNFGTYAASSQGWPMGQNLAPYVQTVSLVSERMVSDPRLHPKPDGEHLTDEIELLKLIGKTRNLVGPAQLSARGPRLEIPSHRIGNTIVVGNGFVDRITFWNLQARTAAWLNGAITNLRLDPTDIEDAARFDAVKEIIRNRMQSENHSGGMHIVVRSGSLDTTALQAIVDKLRASDRWIGYSVDATPLDVSFPVPNKEELEQSHGLSDGGGFFERGSDWHEFEFSEETFRPPTLQPRHLRDFLHMPSGIDRGQWAMDLDIERGHDLSRFENVHHDWRLPRRMSFVGAFTKGRPPGLGDKGTVPRVTRRGLLSLTQSRTHAAPEITVPTDEQAFRYSLVVAPYREPFLRDAAAAHEPLTYDVRPSDKGRYLTALLRLAGGVNRASEIFLSSFWRQQFEMLDATPTKTEDRIENVVASLKRKLPAGTLATETDWHRLAHTVLKEARSVRIGSRYLRYDTLLRRMNDYAKPYWERHGKDMRPEQIEDECRARLKESVQYLCQREILHQGHEWHRAKCKNRNWTSIDAIKRTMICDVCGTEEPAPVSKPWFFKLNPFVLDGLREHALVSYIWCLNRLSQRARSSFYFMEPHELYFSRDNQAPDAEVDLVAVTDGGVRLCEVKSSSRSLDVVKLAAVAKLLRPDIVTIAVMEGDSPALQAKFAALKTALGEEAIEAELLTWHPGDQSESPHLPSGRSMMVQVFGTGRPLD